jgi:TetR/AcrR family transcriptional repressor of nem operon
MARPRQFDREEALDGAIEAFAEDGYAGTTTEALLEAMHLSRQSLYNTFGDKYQLYLEALRRYVAMTSGEQIEILTSARSAREGIERLFDSCTERAPQNCLGIGAVCEFGRSDPAIEAMLDTSAQTLRFTLEKQLRTAKAEGDVAGCIDESAAAHFLLAALTGIKVAARAGASREVLDKIGAMALRCLGESPRVKPRK